MARVAPITVFDRALGVSAAAAATSPKLSAADKKRLATLVTKSRTAKGWTASERMECMALVYKAAPEKLPKAPEWLRKRFERERHQDTPVREPSKVDPLEQLAKAAELRGTVLTEQQFVDRREVILSMPHLATWGREDGVDPLDRVTKAHELHTRDAMTEAQFDRVRQAILDAV